MTVADALESTVEKWNRISLLAPLHRTKLEFRLDEQLFHRFIREIERQLTCEQQSLAQGNADPQQLRQHLAYFAPGPIIVEAEKLILRMGQASQSIRSSSQQPLGLTLVSANPHVPRNRIQFNISYYLL